MIKARNVGGHYCLKEKQFVLFRVYTDYWGYWHEKEKMRMNTNNQNLLLSCLDCWDWSEDVN